MSFEEVLKGHRLLIAEITYRMPDHPSLIQQFVWQEYDTAPKYPRLTRFLGYWQQNLDGELVRVRVAVRGLIAPTDFEFARIVSGLN